jgi:hypothetical protein
MTDTDDRVELTVEGPAAFAGAFVDALQRHGVEVFDFEAPEASKGLSSEEVVTVPLTVAADDEGIDKAVTDFVATFPEAIVREADAGLG